MLYNNYIKGYKGDAHLSIYFFEKDVFEHLKSKELCQYKIDKKNNRINFYVNGKIFAVLSTIHNTEMLTLHFKPDLAHQLQTSHKYIMPCFEYLNSSHWTTIITSVMRDDLLFQLIDLSYDLTLTKMTKREKQQVKYQVEEKCAI